MTNFTKKIIVFYHENCLDGFTSAYVAWKKFKNSAEYIPLTHTATGHDILKNKKIKINDLKDKEIYLIDFCLNQPELNKVIKVAKSVMIIDHHISAKDIVKSIPGSIFKDGVSAAYLAYQYFFPKNKIPKLIKYVSIGDTWTWGQEKFEKEVLAYVRTIKFDFKDFTKSEKELEDKQRFQEIIKTGKLLVENYSKMVDSNLLKAKLISFDKYKVYAVNASSIFTSELGHKLAKMSKDKFSIIYYFENNELEISLRGDNKVDLSKLAKKYHGGGHFNAAGFSSSDKKFIKEFIGKILG